MELQGSQVQGGIFAAGAPAGPVTMEEWAALAREQLSPAAYDYIAGGAGSELTIRENRDAFERRRLRPRMLTGNIERDLSVEVLGMRSPAPFFLAPIGVMGIMHPDRELAVARAARAHGIPMILSSAGSTSIETVAAELGDSPKWYQLYWVADHDIAASFVARAEEAGYGAIVVTVDTLVLAWRDRDLRHAYLPFLHGEGVEQFLSDPVFQQKLGRPVDDDRVGAGVTAISGFSNLALSWRDLAWLRERTSLPILLKGIMTAEDARLAREHGVDGVIVSNHGGRQIDGSLAALDALPEVRDELGPEATVLMDSGIRRGSDVLKAMALGADAVLLGRPYVFALAAAGEAGVEQVIRYLRAEIDLTLALLGGNSVRELDRSFVV